MTVKASMALPARRALSNSGVSKYDLDSLRAGSDDCLLEQDVINVKKATSRLTSAVGSFKKRPGNENSSFAVRTFKDAEGKDVVGVWRLDDKVPAPAASGSPAQDAAVVQADTSNGAPTEATDTQ